MQAALAGEVTHKFPAEMSRANTVTKGLLIYAGATLLRSPRRGEAGL